jgi:hypothetical protein
VDLSVGEILLQIFHNLPPVNEGLKFCGGTQVLKEIAAFFTALEAIDCLEEGAFGVCLLAPCFIAVRFHGCISVLTY